MKRKHSSEAVDETATPAAPVKTPAAAATTTVAVGSTAPKSAAASTDTVETFASFGLDARLLQGIAKLGFASPTLVQAKAIPLALEGKDILGLCCRGCGWCWSWR